MTDRTQLTEARQKVGKIRVLTQGIARDATYLTIALNRLDWAAERLLDFPTDEMVEAAQEAMLRFGPMASMDGMRAALEAIRSTMIGDTQ